MHTAHIHVLDLPALGSRSLYSLSSKSKGGFWGLHEVKSEGDSGKKYRGRSIILESDKPGVTSHVHHVLAMQT